MKLAEYFRKFLSNIEPTPNQAREAASGHATLRSHLESDDNSKECVLDTFLSGSYARNTATRPVKDVDIISVLDLDPSNNTPDAPLSFLQQVLREYYSSICRQRRSLKITLSYVTMDVVPAVAPWGLESQLLIPDRDLSCWIPTHPKGHIAHATQLNAALKDRFVPLVKAMKWWRDDKISNARRPASFLLEVITGIAVTGGSFDSMAAVVCGCFQSIRALYGANAAAESIPVVADPALAGNDVASDWPKEDFLAFMAAADKAADLSEAALKSQDKDQSIALWQAVFGTDFPSSV